VVEHFRPFVLFPPFAPIVFFPCPSKSPPRGRFRHFENHCFRPTSYTLRRRLAQLRKPARPNWWT